MVRNDVQEQPAHSAITLRHRQCGDDGPVTSGGFRDAWGAPRAANCHITASTTRPPSRSVSASDASQSATPKYGIQCGSGPVSFDTSSIRTSPPKDASGPAPAGRTVV